MTNHWIDIQHSDCIMIIGSNAAENHPISFKWVNEARDKRGAKLISVDPRFTRTSATADLYARLRSGTDIAFVGGMINYALAQGRIQWDYVRDYTNAAFLLEPGFKGPAELDGVFSGLKGSKYDKATWKYQLDDNGVPLRDPSLKDPRCVFQHLKRHYARYTIEKVCSITGCDPAVYKQVCELYTATCRPEKSATIMYAMGTTQHTYGSQNVRIYAVLQLLLGNIGVAGGGINALRGESNVQGSTDHAALFHILPGYLKAPNATWQTYAEYVEACTPTTSDPKSANWWGNYPKYSASLLKAFWNDVDLETAYSYLGKIDEKVNYSTIPLISEIAGGKIKGLFCWGQNPAVACPSSRLVRRALARLDWLVCVDLWETDTSCFWSKEAGADPAAIDTEVFLLPAASSIEKEGSISNSGRWAQWRYKAVDPPGEAKDDLAIITELVFKLKELYASGGAFPDPILNLSWNYGKMGLDNRVHHASAREVAREINGYFLKDTEIKGKLYKAGQMVPSFAFLMDDGSTASGNWLYCNSITDDENRLMRRGLKDPTGLGFFHDWAWCWPVNRRVIYNRASVDKQGAPWAKDKPVIWWDGLSRTWKGDVPDGGWAPDAKHPFIMLPEGHARLFAAGMTDGPFPEHYEPLESQVRNLLSAQQVSPVIMRFDEKVKGEVCDPMLVEGCCACTYGSEEAASFPFICTTYRVTEHWQAGQMTRWLPWLVELVPNMFVEMSEELAREKGIKSGDKLRITSIRNREGISAYAYVTKRFKPFTIDGAIRHQVGMLWHFGYKGRATGGIANDLTPFVGDANTMIPEYKAFLVNVEKA